MYIAVHSLMIFFQSSNLKNMWSLLCHCCCRGGTADCPDGTLNSDTSALVCAVGVLTGSDDSTIRRMLFDSSRPLQRLSNSSELGGHASGTGVRALALVPLDGSHGSFRLNSVHGHWYKHVNDYVLSYVVHFRKWSACQCITFGGSEPRERHVHSGCSLGYNISDA